MDLVPQMKKKGLRLYFKDQGAQLAIVTNVPLNLAIKLNFNINS